MSSLVPDFFKKVISTVGSGGSAGGGAGMAPNFPYELDQLLLPPHATGGLWSIHAGHQVQPASWRSEQEQNRVTIFVANIERQPSILPALRNCVRRLKTLRHPHILKYLASVETPKELLMATEAVIPFNNLLGGQMEGKQEENRTQDQNDQQRKNAWKGEQALWAINLLLKALNFLHNEAHIVHGNLRLASVFVTEAGELKLSGFELAASQKDDEALFTDYGRFLRQVDFRNWPPELSSPSSALPWSQLKSLPSHAIDSWMMACLLREIYNKNDEEEEGDGGESKRGMIPSMPNELRSFCQRAMINDPKRRADPCQLLNSSLFKTRLIQAAERLEGLLVEEAEVRERALAGIHGHLDEFPSEFVKYKIVPVLVSLMQTQGQCSLEGIRLMLRGAGRLDAEEMRRMVAPLLAQLFAKPDRAIRLALLDALPAVLGSLEARYVQESIYPQLVSGFGDALPALRESSLKVSLLLAPKLTSRQLNNELLRLYARLQTDAQPGIRVNTTVCLGRVAPLLEESTRHKMLGMALVRALHDPFIPARNAALLAISATADLVRPQDIAQKVLPCVVALMVDPDRAVRTQAFKTTSLLTAKLEAYSAKMPDPIPSPSTSPSAGTTITMKETDAGQPGTFSSWTFGALAQRLMDTTLGGDEEEEKEKELQKGGEGEKIMADELNPSKMPISKPPLTTSSKSNTPSETFISAVHPAHKKIPMRKDSFPSIKQQTKPASDGWEMGDELLLDLSSPSTLQDDPPPATPSMPSYQDDDNPWATEMALLNDNNTFETARQEYSPKMPSSSSSTTTTIRRESRPMNLSGRNKSRWAEQF